MGEIITHFLLDRRFVFVWSRPDEEHGQRFKVILIFPDMRRFLVRNVYLNREVITSKTLPSLLIWQSG